MYHGRLLASNRGQQGCPLMGPLFCLTRRRMWEEARANLQGPPTEFEPEFADDGFSGGTLLSVWASFEQERALAAKYGIRFDFAKTTLYLLAGEHFEGDLRPFRELGIRIVTGCDVRMLQVPVAGKPEHFATWQRDAQQELSKAFEAVEQLPHRHVAFHLLQQCFGFNKISYYCRSIPRSCIEPFLDWYALRMRESFSHILGSDVSDAQWQQAALPPKLGGMGLADGRLIVAGTVISQADIAFLSSWKQCMPIIAGILPTGRAGDGGAHLRSAMTILSQYFPDLDQQEQPKSSLLVQKLQQETADQLISAATLSERVRLHACRAPWANGWITTTPSLTEDTFMPNVAFQDSVSMRLGMTVFQDDEGCPYCHQVSDRHGRHAISCMKVGTHTKVHHSLRDCLYRLAQEANLRPQLEASGLLPDAPQRRPADVLLPTTNLLKQTSWRRYSSLALDCAVVSPFAISAPARATEEPAATAKAYAEHKRRAQDTARQCATQNIGFQPIIFEMLGGCDLETASFLNGLCQDHDGVQHRRPGSCRRLLQTRVAFLLQRHIGQTLMKYRRAQAKSGSEDAGRYLNLVNS